MGIRPFSFTNGINSASRGSSPNQCRPTNMKQLPSGCVWTWVPSNFIKFHPSLFSHEKVILSGNLTWLMENCSLIMHLPTKMVIVHSYVSLPKGNFEDLVAFLGSNRGKPVLRFQKRRWSKRWSQAMESWPLLQPTFMITCHQAPSKYRAKRIILRWFDRFNVVNPVY